MADALPPGSTIGILGGGQLGRMMAIAAARLGLKVHVFEPAPSPPAADVAAAVTRAAWDDAAALARFAAAVDVVTFEFENVPVATAEALAAHVPVRPSPRALAVSQDRLAEKTFLAGLGLATAPFRAVETAAGLDAAIAAIGLPAILKTRRMGYDGKGQVRINAGDDPARALAALAGASAILEGVVAFRREVSVIGARGLSGEVACFDPGENLHRDGILHTTTVPAALTAGRRADAVLIAARILTALDYVGVLGVELFDTGGSFVVNEIAPRVHNSGHWTIEACITDQFAQAIRAVAGWPLGDGARHSDAVMTNLIGADAARWASLAAEPGTAIHLYGKSEIRPGRKMGHVTRLTPRSPGRGPAGP